MHIEIEWLSDSTDCDQAGCSGGYSTGARVFIDGALYLERLPVAACYGGESWDQDEVYAILLSKLLGATVEQSYG